MGVILYDESLQWLVMASTFRVLPQQHSTNMHGDKLQASAYATCSRQHMRPRLHAHTGMTSIALACAFHAADVRLACTSAASN